MLKQKWPVQRSAGSAVPEAEEQSSKQVAEEQAEAGWLSQEVAALHGKLSVVLTMSVSSDMK